MWARQENIDERRAKVSRMRARGFSVREIADELSRPLDEGGLVNPDTGEPYSVATIGLDFVYLDQQWQEEAARTTAMHKAQVLKELEEVKRFGWSLGTAKGADLVLKALGRQCLVLGLHDQVSINNFINVNLSELTEAQLQALAQGMDPSNLIEGEVREVKPGTNGHNGAGHVELVEPGEDPE